MSEPAQPFDHRFFGISLYVDAMVPPGKIELRDEKGVVVRIDLPAAADPLAPEDSTAGGAE